ncbi:Transcription initiation factor TFIID subunit 10 [Galdieria sulphuraria]|uniref:Transcription initiation factor TFIID subunit D8 n=1 Tax=Galdieria sulphuraria TaxID=130081 RepID=M2WS48_GALSU|nr:transcription initiation factor TFIID subunit D8 [Galdieria sulphuraria]EME26670.1 transcription initiation factor TFIID subunit D8 [Galdieria sulphuraria]GJD05582.1 Transcription initiation factor TFIID subunit 10 [Galdieria sulphuraria]|eukprot:XP_005703190.1 transcription initiation factor TFIID subunit D8 [Galdieria sulphuraria]
MDLFETSQIEKLLESLENYQPAFPDALVRYYLAKSGFQTDDIRAERLVALAAQKFVADVANDALNHVKLRQQSQATSKKSKENEVILTVEDLSKALEEYGVHLKKPPYYVDSPVVGVGSANLKKRKTEQVTSVKPEEKSLEGKEVFKEEPKEEDKELTQEPENV